jgi:LysM repeat protein
MFGMVLIMLAIGAGSVYAVLQGTGQVVEPTISPTATLTTTTTLTPTATLTGTPAPTWTPLPPIDYVVQAGDVCSGIAAFFDVSVQSIVVQNRLPADCGLLSPGQTLLIPQPTPTASPMPTSTLNPSEATEISCEKYDYTVGENDTLSGIALNYNVTMESIKEYNSLTSDIVYQGMLLKIPLCKRNPTPGPTPTATPPPPYAAPNLLLPADGTTFLSTGEVITLQWASVGTLRENETYAVTIEDITEGTGRKITDYVKDTKYIVPASFRPNSETPHIIRWVVNTVRQVDTDEEGQPVYESAGNNSISRVFSWAGSTNAPAPVATTAPAPTATP